MLKRPLPGMFRHMIGIAVIVGLTASGGFAAWAGQATASNRGPTVLVDMKMKMTSSQSNEVSAAETRYLVHSGELRPDMQGLTSAFVCTPFLTNNLARSPAGNSTKTRGLPFPINGQIWLDCATRKVGKAVATPAALASDGQTTTIETNHLDGLNPYRIEFSATMSKERIAEAQNAADKC